MTITNNQSVLNKNVSLILTCSTSDVSKTTILWLEEQVNSSNPGCILYEKNEYGFLLVRIEGEDLTKFPKDLQNLYRYADKMNCKFINMDVDADTIDELHSPNEEFNSCEEQIDDILVICPHCNDKDLGNHTVLNNVENILQIPLLLDRLNEDMHSCILECNECHSIYLEDTNIVLTKEEIDQWNIIWKNYNKESLTKY